MKSPMVAQIHIAPGRRLAMKPVTSVEAEEGKGLVGDRYHGSRYQHVTIQSLDDLAQGAAELGLPITAQATRRNLTIDVGSIPTTKGCRIRVGAVDFEVVRAANPCKLLDDVIGAGASIALRGRAGALCRVLSSGTLRVGDCVAFLPVDSGLGG